MGGLLARPISCRTVLENLLRASAGLLQVLSRTTCEQQPAGSKAFVRESGRSRSSRQRGGTDIFHQASVLTLYDPDRSQTVTHLGQTRTWGEALAAIRDAVQKQRQTRRRAATVDRNHRLADARQQIENLLKDLPEAKWHVYEPIHRDMAWRGAQWRSAKRSTRFTTFARPTWCFRWMPTSCSAVPGNLRYAADFMARRRVRTTDTGRRQGDE